MLLNRDGHRWQAMLKYILMDKKYKQGDTVYFISENGSVEEATYVMYIAGFATIRFANGSGGTRIREYRLYFTREEAEAANKE